MSIFDKNKTGRDHRFSGMIRVGRVAEIVTDEGTTAARAAYADKENQISAPLAIIQPSAGARKSFKVPKVGQSCVTLHLPNGEQAGFMLGTFYNTSDPPPVTDPLKDHTTYADGTVVEYDEGTSTMTVAAKGPLNIATSGPVTIRAASVSVEAATIRFTGNVEILGDLIVSGPAMLNGGGVANPQMTNANGSGGGS
jgi:phage baseplate assembly protein V